MSDGKLTIIEALLFAIFAGVGGMLSYLMRTYKLKVKPAFSQAIVEGLSSAFVGVIAMMACKAMDVDIYWSGVIVGVFGWLGAETSIVILAKLVKGRLGIDDSCKPKK